MGFASVAAGVPAFGSSFACAQGKNHGRRASCVGSISGGNMRKTGILLMVLAGVVAAQQTEQPPQQPPQTPAGQAPASMQQGVQEPLPPPPAQVKVRETNLVEKVQAASASDVYCGGFIRSQAVPEHAS